MPADLLDASTFRESDTYQSSLQIATTTHHSQTSVPLFVPSTIQNQQQQQQSLMVSYFKNKIIKKFKVYFKG